MPKKEITDKVIADAVAGLSERERHVLRERFGIDFSGGSNEEILTAIHGITRSKIEKFERKTLKKPSRRRKDSRSSIVSGLLTIFVGSAVAVFGLLLLTMLELQDFSGSAFRYWTPRALGVILITTILGLTVVHRNWKTRVAFGVLIGLTVSAVYLWATN